MKFRKAADMPPTMARRVQARQLFSQTKTLLTADSNTTLNTGIINIDLNSNGTVEQLKHKGEGLRYSKNWGNTAVDAPMVKANHFMLNQSSTHAL